MGLSIEDVTGRVIARRYKGTRNEDRVKGFITEVKKHFAGKALGLLTTDDLADYAEACEEAGNAVSTINVKLSFVNTLFDEFKAELKKEHGPAWSAPEVPWRSGRKRAKWWLKPDMEPKVIQYVLELREAEFADFISFITHTGCRVEEALRLQRQHFDFEAGELTIPGTKTDNSQRTVPLMQEALDLAKHRLRHAAPTTYLFRFSPSDPSDEEVYVYRSYKVINKKWRKVKARFGWMKDSTATLKALRRTFARRANDRGMPTEMLRDYLGHSDIATTVEYLRLVGGHNREAMRGFLS